MSDVLTTTAPLLCPHAFPITVLANATLTVGRVSVFGSPDLQNGIVACTFAQAPCTKVASVGTGASALVVDGNAVVLDSVVASTNVGLISVGPPPPPPGPLTAS